MSSTDRLMCCNEIAVACDAMSSKRRPSGAVIASIVVMVVVLLVAYWLLREPTPPSAMLGPSPTALPADGADGGGVALAVQSDDPGLAQIGARWYFNWDVRPHEDVELEFVPLVCGYPGDGQVSEQHLHDIEAAIRSDPESYPDGTMFLIGNEIGYTHQNDGRSPGEYAEDFHRCHTLLTSINPSFDVAVGPAILTPDEGITNAIVDAVDGLDYLRQVIETYQAQRGEPIPAAHFAATNHVMHADEIDVFESRIVDMRRLLAEHGLHDRGVILTEIGVPTRGSTAEQIEGFMQDAIRFAATATDDDIGHPDDGRLVQRWAWFMAQPISIRDKLETTGTGAFFLRFAQTSLFDGHGDLTHLGKVYRDMTTEQARS